MTVTVETVTTACAIQTLSRMTALVVELVSLVVVMLVLPAPSPTEVQVFVTVTMFVYSTEKPPSPPSRLEPRTVLGAPVSELDQVPASP